MPSRRIAAVISPFLTFVDWLFSGFAPWVELFYGSLGGAWLVLMLARPDVFDRGNLVGMQWAPDRFWIVFVALTASLHFIGLVRLHAIKLRAASNLLTSWYWLSIAISLARSGLSTGPISYALLGVLALLAAIYISGRRVA